MGSGQPGSQKQGTARRELDSKCRGPHLKDGGEGGHCADDAAGIGGGVVVEKEADKHLQADRRHIPPEECQLERRP